MTNTQVNQTENKAFVVGVLKEKKIDFKLSSTGKQMATGKLVVICDTPMGKGEVEVRVMQFADKKDGTANSLYKALHTIEETYKTNAQHGEGNGDIVKIEGSFADETYYSVKKGDFVEKMQIKGTFINRVDSTTPHCCKVAFEGFIAKSTPVNSELEVEIIGVGYEGIAVPVKVTIPENLVGAFQGRYAVGCTTSLNVAILNMVTTKQVSEEVGFGEGLGEVITTTTIKRLVFGGGNPKYQGTTGAISEETIKQGLALRQAKLDAKKEETINKNNSGGASMEGGFGNTGFGTPAPQGFGGASMPTGGFNNAGFGGFPQ